MHQPPASPARRRRTRSVVAAAVALVAPTLAAVVPIAAQQAAAAPPTSITIVGDSATALGQGTADDRSVYSFSSGANFSEIRAALTNTNNFGPSGTVKTSVTISPTGINSPTQLASSGAQVYVTAARPTYTQAEITAIQNFVKAGGAVVLLGNSPSDNGTGYDPNTGTPGGTRTVISDPTAAITGFSMAASGTFDNYCQYTTSGTNEVRAATLIGPDNGPGLVSRDAAAGANNPLLDGPFGADIATINVWHTVGTLNVPANATRLLDVSVPARTFTGPVTCDAAPDPDGSGPLTPHAAAAGSWHYGSWSALSGVLLAVQGAGVNGTGSGPVVAAGDVDLFSNAYNTTLTEGSSRLGRNVFAWVISQLDQQQQPPAPPSGPIRFTRLAPTRIVDTRATSSPIGNGETRSIQIAGQAGVPADAKAVALNVTIDAPTANGYLTVYPSASGLPGSSNLNFFAGITVANFVVGQLGSDGKLSFFHSAGTSNLIVDVVGYYGSGAGDGLTSQSPVRIMDTRNGTGGHNGPLAGAESHTLQVTGTAGVPSGASAVVINLTATNPTATAYLTAWPSDQATQPVVSNLNFYAGITTANFAIVPLSADGKINVFNSAGSTDVIVDVLGFFSTGGGAYNAVAPNRVLDARGNSAPRFSEGEVRTVQISGGSSGVPAGATAVILNLTATEPTANAYLTAFPGDQATAPTASNVNFYAGFVKPNLVLVRLSPEGTIKILNAFGTTGVLVDVMGYVSAPS